MDEKGLEIEKNLQNEIKDSKDIEKEQNKFLNSKIGSAINGAVDLGLRAVLPDIVEDEILNIKNSMLQNGLKAGIQTAIDSALDLGKSAIGIVTGKFENIDQVQNAIKKGGIIDTAGDTVKNIVDAVVKKGVMPKELGKAIKSGSDTLAEYMEEKIKGTIESQNNYIEKLNKYANTWSEAYNAKDFAGMTREYNKMKTGLKEVMPIENILKSVREIETVHNLVKNNGKQFGLTEEELELAKKLSA